MDAMRRRGTGAAVLAAVMTAMMTLAGIGGCASSMHPEYTYSETFTSVLIAQDNAHLVALGRTHHYVFDAPPAVVQVLHSPLRPRVSAEFSTFHVDPESVISGDYALRLPAGLAAADETEAAALGFRRAGDGSWRAAGHLQGRRFEGWTYRLGEEQQKLNEAYTVTITVDAHHGDAVVRSLDTPIRVTADGVQLLYYAPLAPFLIPVIFATAARDH